MRHQHCLCVNSYCTYIALNWSCLCDSIAEPLDLSVVGMEWGTKHMHFPSISQSHHALVLLETGNLLATVRAAVDPGITRHPVMCPLTNNAEIAPRYWVIAWGRLHFRLPRSIMKLIDNINALLGMSWSRRYNLVWSLKSQHPAFQFMHLMLWKNNLKILIVWNSFLLPLYL